MNFITHLTLVVVFALYKVNECAAGNTNNSIESFNTLSNVKTGYFHQESTFKRLAESFTNKEIKQTLAQEILCSYLYIGLYYVRLTRYIIESGDNSYFDEVLADINYLFEDKAISLLTSLFNFHKGLSLSALWWIYMYADYFKNIVGRVIAYDQETVKRFCHVVEDRLDVYINIFYQCKHNNVFNESYEQSHYFRNINVIKNDMNSLKLKWNFLGPMHYNLEMFLIFNANYLSTTRNREYFNINKLQFEGMLKDKYTLRILIKDFAKIVNWENILNSWLGDYKLFMSSNSNTVRYTGIGKMLSKLIDLLKLIMLQILQKHLHYANYIKCHQTVIDQRANYNDINDMISDMLGVFVRILNLESDIHFCTVVCRFAEPGTKFFDVVQNNSNIEDIWKYLDELKLSLYGCELTRVEKYDRALAEDSVKNLLEYAGANSLIIPDKTKQLPYPFIDTVMSIQVFVQYVEQILRNTNFMVVRSFIEFSKDIVKFHPRPQVNTMKSTVSRNNAEPFRRSKSESNERFRSYTLQRAGSEPHTRKWSRINASNDFGRTSRAMGLDNSSANSNEVEGIRRASSEMARMKNCI